MAHAPLFDHFRHFLKKVAQSGLLKFSLITIKSGAQWRKRHFFKFFAGDQKSGAKWRMRHFFGLCATFCEHNKKIMKKSGAKWRKRHFFMFFAGDQKKWRKVARFPPPSAGRKSA